MPDPDKITTFTIGGKVIKYEQRSYEAKTTETQNNEKEITNKGSYEKPKVEFAKNKQTKEDTISLTTGGRIFKYEQSKYEATTTEVASIGKESVQQKNSEFDTSQQTNSGGRQSPRQNTIQQETTVSSYKKPLAEYSGCCDCMPDDARECIDPKYIFDDEKCECVYNYELFPPLFIP